MVRHGFDPQSSRARLRAGASSSRSSASQHQTIYFLFNRLVCIGALNTHPRSFPLHSLTRMRLILELTQGGTTITTARRPGGRATAEGLVGGGLRVELGELLGAQHEHAHLLQCRAERVVGWRRRWRHGPCEPGPCIEYRGRTKLRDDVLPPVCDPYARCTIAAVHTLRLVDGMVSFWNLLECLIPASDNNSETVTRRCSRVL